MDKNTLCKCFKARKLQYSILCRYCFKIIMVEKDHLSGRDRTREKVRIRDNYTCQGCGKKWQKGQRRLDVHH